MTRRLFICCCFSILLSGGKKKKKKRKKKQQPACLWEVSLQWWRGAWITITAPTHVWCSHVFHPTKLPWLLKLVQLRHHVAQRQTCRSKARVRRFSWVVQTLDRGKCDSVDLWALCRQAGWSRAQQKWLMVKRVLDICCWHTKKKKRQT